MITLTYPMVKEIFDTLPIGYYLGRPIDAQLSATESDSYYNMATDKIIVSFPTIQAAAKLIDENELECITRSFLYHEISHAILTPKKLFGTAVSKTGHMHDIVNIVEDERIETYCRNLYMNTNFKRSLVILNNGIPETIDADSAFYKLIRYHIGEEYWVNRSHSLIATYLRLTENYVYNYVNDIQTLYDDFCKWFNSKGSEASSDKSKNSDDKNTENTTANNKENTTSETEQTKISMPADHNSSSTMDNDAENNNNALDDTTSTADDEINKKKSLEEALEFVDKLNEQETIPAITKKDFIKVATKLFMHWYNPVYIERVRNIVINACKRNKQTGAAINSYSGRINPRAVGTRDDYRWWVQKNREGHIKQFNKLHFNLFIDNSGSFVNNDENMNKFLRALDVATQENKDFTFDVITINMDINEWTNHNQIFKSRGGNRLLPEIGDVIRRHQKPQCNNYNIVLFDGDAHSDDEYNSYKKNADIDKEPFAFFDHTNTFIITDTSNEVYIERANIHQANVRYCEDYCDQFIDTICNTLEQFI